MSWGTGRPASNASSANENVDPRIEATRSRFTVSPGSRLSRRNRVSRKLGGSEVESDSTRPSRTTMAPSSSSARSSSITNSGLPPAAPTCSSSRGPAGSPTIAPVRLAASSTASGPTTTCAAPRASRSATARSTSGPWLPPRTVTNTARRRRVSCRAME